MLTRHLLFTLAVLLLGAGSVTARTPVPAPPPSAPENTIYQPDLQWPFNPAGRLSRSTTDEPAHQPGAATENRTLEVGGDDVLIDHVNIAYWGQDLAVDSQGVFYSVGTVAEDEGNLGLEIRRSTNGGETWGLYASFANPDPAIDYDQPCLHIAEGAVDRLYLAYRHRESNDSTLTVSWTPLGDVPTWTHVPVDNPTGVVGNPALTSDVSSYDQFYLYLAYDFWLSDTSEIRFTRSTDYGETFETPYTLAQLGLGDREYSRPVISYGYGHYVHVAWTFEIDSDVYDGALRYRRAPNFAAGGQASWESITAPTSAIDGRHDFARSLTASYSSNQIVMSFETTPTGTPYYNAALVTSLDQGASWDDPQYLDFSRPYDVVQDPDDLTWYVSAFENIHPGYIRASSSDLTAWSEFHTLSPDQTGYESSMVLDPSHDDRPAVFWAHHLGTGLG